MPDRVGEQRCAILCKIRENIDNFNTLGSVTFDNQEKEQIIKTLDLLLEALNCVPPQRV